MESVVSKAKSSSLSEGLPAISSRFTRVMSGTSPTMKHPHEIAPRMFT